MFSVNQDALGGVGQEDASYGPKVGFMQSMATAYDATIRETSNGINENMRSQYKRQTEALKELGDEGYPELPNADPYELGEYFSGENRQPRFLVSEVDNYDQRILELREKHPGLDLRTTREMWGKVQEEYGKSTMDNDAQRRTFAGKVGAFVGDMAGAVDPRYNLTNAAASFVPVGRGATFVGTLGKEFLVNAGVESVNEFTGGRTTREILGGDTSLSGTVARIGMAGAAGATVRGVAEGVARGGKAAYNRWFRDAPELGDPAPPMPPPRMELTPEQMQAELKLRDQLEAAGALPSRTTGQRIMGSRTQADADHISAQLDAWDGNLPINIKPEGVRFSEDITTRGLIGQLTVDEMARRVDPKIFGIYDELAARKASLRSMIDDVRPDPELDARVSELNTKLNDIEQTLDTAPKFGRGALSAQKRKRMETQASELRSQREALIADVRTKDTPEMADLRQQLMDTDYKMRDLAEPVSRAYSRARGEWEMGQEYRAAVRDMVREGADRLPGGMGEGVTPIFTDTSPTLGELAARAPILNQMPLVADKVRPGWDAADYAKAIVETEQKVMDETAQAFRDSIPATLKIEKGDIELGGTGLKLNLDNDRIHVVRDDGSIKEMSVREMLEEQDLTEAELKAVTTCST